MRFLTSLLFVATVIARPAWAAPKASVTLEVLTRPGVALGASQQWYKTLSELNLAGVQIHGGGAGDEVGVTELGSASAPAYKVISILSSDNVLILPGGKFKPADIAGLRKWFADLSDQGAEGVTQPRPAFGLTPRQLEEVNEDLKKPVVGATQGMTSNAAVRQIAAHLKFSLLANASAERELKSVKVREELSGLSCGTALAAILRPAGLVLRPSRPQGGQLEYRVEPARAGVEAWPVGWKPQAKPNKVLGELLEFLNVEIHETPVSEALEAIEGRLKVPFLYDRNAMAQQGIDPTKAQADVPEKRLTYSQILNKVLLQAKLKYELRVDEADKPFLWITTVKRVP